MIPYLAAILMSLTFGSEHYSVVYKFGDSSHIYKIEFGKNDLKVSEQNGRTATLKRSNFKFFSDVFNEAKKIKASSVIKCDRNFAGIISEDESFKVASCIGRNSSKELVRLINLCQISLRYLPTLRGN